MKDIQSRIDPIFKSQDATQFGLGRYAYFFKPGSYTLNVDVGYYMTIHGLGELPDQVTITGSVRSLATKGKNSALENFWRGVENLAIEPTEANINAWAVSQATWLRRVHIKGQLFLFDFHFPGDAGFTSGGFIADSVVDVQVVSASQQQFLTRNTTLTNWDGGVWNMVFVGDEQPPSRSWPKPPYTVVDKTPVIREKPYLIIDGKGNYAVKVPGLKKDSQGTSWFKITDSADVISIDRFHIAQPGIDTADSLNDALRKGYHLIFTPGIYHLNKCLEVKYADTVILGLGMATLVPDNGTPAMVIDDVDGVSVCGIIIEAGSRQSPQLLVVGSTDSHKDHSANPTALFDMSCRVGSSVTGSTLNCFTINAKNVILDNTWIWRADHKEGGIFVEWTEDIAKNGLTVNGENVIAYGLFVEHFQGIQTLWNGEGGQVYFYQSEIPYDVPDQSKWQQQNGENGYPSYKVADHVTSHIAKGLGVYCFFRILTNKVQLDNAIETPTGPGIQMSHMVTVWLNGNPSSSINHIINGTGAPVFGHVPNTGAVTSFSSN